MSVSEGEDDSSLIDRFTGAICQTTARLRTVIVAVVTFLIGWCHDVVATAQAVFAVGATAVVGLVAVGFAKIAFFVACLDFAVTAAWPHGGAVKETMPIRAVILAVVAGFAQ